MTLLVAAALALSGASPSPDLGGGDTGSPTVISAQDAFGAGGTKRVASSDGDDGESQSKAGGKKGAKAKADPDDGILTCRQMSRSESRPDLCKQDVQTCPAAQASSGSGAYLQWRLAARNGRRGSWRLVDTRCVSLDEVAPGMPAYTVREFRRLPLPAGKANIEPSGRPVLINIDTNVYVDAAPVVLHTRVVGIGIDVRATPTTFTWTFGDGERLVTTDHGAPYPDMRTTHVYTEPGKWPVTLTTTYTGQYRLAGTPGAPWIPIIGTASVTSPTITLDVIEARAVLVP